MLQEINEQNFSVAATPERAQKLIAGVWRPQQSSKLSVKLYQGKSVGNPETVEAPSWGLPGGAFCRAKSGSLRDQGSGPGLREATL